MSNNRSDLRLGVTAQKAKRYMFLQSTFTKMLDVPTSFFEPLIKDYEATCIALGLAPEILSRSDHVTAHAITPKLSPKILGRLEKAETLCHRARRIFDHTSPR